MPNEKLKAVSIGKLGEYDTLIKNYIDEAIPSDISDLDDVSISSASNGQVLTYDGTAEEWKNTTSVTTIQNGSGTDMTKRTNLQFKGAAQVSDDSANNRTIIEVQTMTASDLEDILDTIPSSGVVNLEDIGDVNLNNVTDGQILAYDATNEEWVNSDGGSQNVQSDWDQSDSMADDYIKNKPTLGTAASKDVATSGDATNTQVVMGNDSRLTDARNSADVTDVYSPTGTVPVSGTAVSSAISTAIGNLPEYMIFKGTLGTGGTITDLPTAASQNEGFTYKVITDNTYASQAAKVGDMFISDGTAWILIPSGESQSSNVEIDDYTIIKNNNDELAVNDFIGTQNEFEEALENGDIQDGAVIYITDDEETDGVFPGGNSGGGGDTRYSSTDIYTNTTRSTIMQLSSSIYNFDEIEIVTKWAYGNIIYHLSNKFLTKNIDLEDSLFIGGNNSRWCALKVTNGSTLTWSEGSDNAMYVSKITGINYH